jgi:hypothetical protein
MEKFLKVCTDLGVDKVGERPWKLIAAITAQTSDCVLFFICGYDFIFSPNDRKFQGLYALFLADRAPFEINIYPDCRAAIVAALAAPAGVVGGGTRAGGVGNYNIQTKALEMVVTHQSGLSFQGSLREVVSKSKLAFAQRLAPTTPFQHQLCAKALTDMRNRLTSYWGSEIRTLGLSR